MLIYGELQTFTRILIDNLIYDLGIMEIVYEIWNHVRPPYQQVFSGKARCWSLPKLY